MALINCPECGHQMSDTTKKCPNCGYSKPMSKETKSIIFSCILGVVSLSCVVLGMMLPSNFFRYRVVVFNDKCVMGLTVFIVGIILLYFSCRLLKNKIKHYNKIFYITFSICVVSFISAFFCFGITTEAILRANIAKAKQAEGEAKRRVEEEASQMTTSLSSTTDESVSPKDNVKETPTEESYVGTYEITECDGSRTVVLTVNADETATMRYKDGDYIEYGSWHKYSTMKYAQFRFRGTIKNLKFSTLNVCKLGSFVLMDEYMYSSSDAADAKDPRERLKLKRISAE